MRTVAQITNQILRSVIRYSEHNGVCIDDDDDVDDGDDNDDKSYSQLELGWGVLQRPILNEVVDRTSFLMAEEIIHAKQSIDCLFDRFFRKMYSWMTLWKATKSDHEATSEET